jgi:L-lactate dehydrogenase (cytochrome)
MQLLGVTSLDELEPRHVTQLQRLAPVPRSVRPMEVATTPRGGTGSRPAHGRAGPG